MHYPQQTRNVPLLSNAARHYSSEAGHTTSKISLALKISVLGAVTYTIYHFAKPYLFVQWPASVRDNSKYALLASNKGDHALGVKYFDIAWKACKKVQLSELRPHPYQIISGLGIAYATECIAAGNSNKAIELLEETYDILNSQLSHLDEQDRVRLVAIASRLGDLSESLNYLDRANKWHSTAVKHTLDWFRVPSTDVVSPNSINVAFPKPRRHLLSSIFDWDSEMADPDPSAPFLNFARYWSRRGNHDLAIPLYITTLGILLPGGAKSQAEWRADPNACRGAVVMAEISSLLLRVSEESSDSTMPNQEQEHAKQWAEHGLAIAKQRPEGDENCASACIESTICLATFFERTGSYERAMALYKDALTMAQHMVYADAADATQQSVRRLLDLMESKKS